MKRPAPLTRWMLISLVVYAGVAVTGVLVARQSSEMRDLFQRLTHSEAIRDEHLRQYRLLLLERATLTGYQNVERVAEQRLGMRFPETVVKVAR